MMTVREMVLVMVLVKVAGCHGGNAEAMTFAGAAFPPPHFSTRRDISPASCDSNAKMRFKAGIQNITTFTSKHVCSVLGVATDIV